MRDSGFTPNAFTDALIAKSYYRPFAADIRVRRQALESLPALLPLASVTVLSNLVQAGLDSHDILSTLQFLIYFNQSTVKLLIRPLISADLDCHTRILSNKADKASLPDGINDQSLQFRHDSDYFRNFHQLSR